MGESISGYLRSRNSRPSRVCSFLFLFFFSVTRRFVMGKFFNVPLWVYIQVPLHICGGNGWRLYFLSFLFLVKDCAIFVVFFLRPAVTGSLTPRRACAGVETIMSDRWPTLLTGDHCIIRAIRAPSRSGATSRSRSRGWQTDMPGLSAVITIVC